MSRLDRFINYYPPMLQPQVDNFRVQLISQTSSGEIINFGHDTSEPIRPVGLNLRISRNHVEFVGYATLGTVSFITGVRFMEGSLSNYRDWNEPLGDLCLAVSMISGGIGTLSNLAAGSKLYDILSKASRQKSKL